MLESERLAYLNALGITQYVALEPIAGARVLPELAPDQIWSEEEVLAPANEVALEQIQPTVSEAVPVQPETAQLDSEKSELQAPKPEEQGSAEVPQLDLSKLKLEAEPAAKPKPKAPVRIERFALAVITIPDRFRLMVELSQADAPGLSAVEHRMVSDLLRVLGCGDGLDQYGAKLYRWPMVNNPRIAADPQAARDGLLGFVASAPAVQKSVFLGRRAATVLGSDTPGQVFALTSDSASQPGSETGNALSCHSLAELQADWRLKAATWGYVLPFLSPLVTPEP